MAPEVAARQAAHEILVMAAAVADYRPRRAEPRKIPGRQERLALDLLPTADILASLAGRRDGKVTDRLRARRPTQAGGGPAQAGEKGADCIVSNNPTRPGSEFGGETNEVTFLHPRTDGEDRCRSAASGGRRGDPAAGRGDPERGADRGEAAWKLPPEPDASQGAVQEILRLAQEDRRRGVAVLV